MNLLSNSMGIWWKLSFVSCALFTVIMLFEGFFGRSFPSGRLYIDEEALLFGIIPMTIWLTSRWLSLKE